MKLLDLKAQAITVDRREGVLAVVEGDDAMKLVRVKVPKLIIEELYSFSGRGCSLLAKALDTYLINIDNVLFVTRDLVDVKRALEVNAGNDLWHVCETPRGVVVQEYGRPPTSLWTSSDGHYWSRLLTNLEVDPKSKHFHSIAYDTYRDVVYATLGDGNPVRAVVIYDRNFKHLYRGPWQFVPIAALKHMVVFGFDSGIAKGGVGIFYPEYEKCSFIFLKWANESVKACQMCDLIQLDDGTWLSALGSPQAIVASKDLKQWHLIYAEGFERRFNRHMCIREYGSKVVCCTGRKLLFIDKAEIEDKLRGEPIVTSYRGFIDKVRGAIFMAKRMR